jgi:hypothetical protein
MTMRRNIKRTMMGVALGGVMAAVSLMGGANAAITFNPETGAGFIGKGDVQLTYGWTNKQLQDNASKVQFRTFAETEVEYEWVCTQYQNNGNVNTHEKASSTTTKINGVVSSVARVKNQVTGFNLTKYSAVKSESSSSQGPALNSCPNNQDLTTAASLEAPTSVTVSLKVQVSIDGVDWIVVPQIL